MNKTDYAKNGTAGNWNSSFVDGRNEPAPVMEDYINLEKAYEDSLKKYEKVLKEKAQHERAHQEEIGRLQSQIKSLETKLADVTRRYTALSESKLGRLTLAHWNRQSTSRKTRPDADVRKNRPPVSAVEAAQPQEKRRQRESYYQKAPVKAAIVGDPAFSAAFQGTIDFLPVTGETARDLIAEEKPDLLFIAPYYEDEGVHSNDEYLRVLRVFQQSGIPAAMVTDSDRSHYADHLEIARQCSYVFTTSTEYLRRYLTDCDHGCAAAVMPGIDPMVHNPVGLPIKRRNGAFYAGDWRNQTAQGSKDLALLLDGVISSGLPLSIVPEPGGDSPEQIPEQYQAYVQPCEDEKEFKALCQSFNWAININPFPGDDSCFSRRVPELLADGAAVLSNYNTGVNSYFPVVSMAHDESEVGRILNGFTEEECYERQIFGIRSVMTGHTKYDRMAEILGKLGLDASPAQQRSVLILTGKPDDPRVIDSFERQTYQNKKLLGQKDLTADILRQFDIVTWFDPDAFYGEFYLEDMVNGFKYTTCDYVTKDAWVADGVLQAGVEHNYVSRIRSGFRTLFWRASFPDEFFRQVPMERSIDNGYSIDHFSYWEGDRKREENAGPYVLSVVIPVYNNGMHLYGKCFSSLRRSSLFRRMKLIMVDDGSTDALTERIETYLCDRYSNIELYQFRDGGSGSASRPRNKGVEMVTTDYLTFLDPDNEAIFDGYYQLYQLASEGDYDVVAGNIYRFHDKKDLFNYFDKYNKTLHGFDFPDGISDRLDRTNLLAPSIQGMVIRKALIARHGLEQVPGAAGQDTLFSWQLQYCARSFRVVDLPIHIYYAYTAGSVTNTVTPRYFQKLLALQEKKCQWLTETGLIGYFMAKRFSTYNNGWVLKKLADAKEPEKCVKLVEQIMLPYLPYYKNDSLPLNGFL